MRAMSRTSRALGKLRYWLRQLVPTEFRSVYRTENGDHHFSVWWMWLGRVFRHTDVVYDPDQSDPRTRYVGAPNT